VSLDECIVIDREQFARSALTTMTGQSDYNINQDLVLGVSGLEIVYYREKTTKACGQQSLDCKSIGC
jgi:hypothetical protein